MDVFVSELKAFNGKEEESKNQPKSVRAEELYSRNCQKRGKMPTKTSSLFVAPSLLFMPTLQHSCSALATTYSSNFEIIYFFFFGLDLIIYTH